MPIDAASVANVLRYGADSIGLIIVKLKPETKLPDFASDYDYIFFALSVLQQIKLQGQVNVAMEMAFCGHLTAKEFSHNFSEIVKSFIANDKTYQLMNTIKGTLAYWK